MKQRRSSWFSSASLLGMALILLAGCASAPLRDTQGMQAAAHVDRAKFLGNWYIIANIPYFAERGKVATRVQYVKRDDGRVDDLYYFRKRLDGPEQHWSGVAWPLDEHAVRWKARFVWPFSTEFWVVDVDTDYQVALIATPDAKLAWIYARTPTLNAERMEQATRRLAEFGVDTNAMVPIPQLAPDAR